MPVIYTSSKKESTTTCPLSLFLQSDNKVRLHRYICLWGASERKLGKSLKPNQKDPRHVGGSIASDAEKLAKPFAL
jgi:hypothetical protein